MSEHFIQLENISLTIPASDLSNIRSLRQSLKSKILTKKNESYTQPLTILQDISLYLKNGDRLGLIGSNGSGKSTLLKLLAGIYQPTQGNYRFSGDVRCMLNVDVGLEIEASGYENILIFCAVENYSRKVTQQVFTYVEKFSGLGDYLYAPVRTYSSGMSTRLSFALITAFEAEILLIDEFFSTGDVSFITQSSQRLKSIISNSSIFVFASHDLVLMQELCPKALFIEKGEIVNYDHTKNICKQYLERAQFAI